MISRKLFMVAPACAAPIPGRRRMRQQRQRIIGSGGAAIFRAPIEIDGSSTVYPFTEAAAEDFQADNPKSKSQSATRAPAAASRSSAPARPTSPTPPGRSRPTKRSRSASRTASPRPSSRSPTTVSRSSPTRERRSTA